MPAVAVVSANKRKPSETFIHNHVRHLPADVHYWTGDWLPLWHCRGLDGEDAAFVTEEPRRSDEPDWQHRERERARRAQAIARRLRDARIDAVLAECGLAGVEMLGPCREAGVPLIVHFHGFDAYRDDILNGDYGKRYPELFASAAALIGVSRAMCAQLERLGARPGIVHWNPCGYDTALFPFAGDAGARPPVFLSAGRFVEKKAPFLVLLAFERVLRTRPDARLWMAGDGPLRLACQSLARALGIEDAVRFLGEIPQPELAVRMAEARGFVQHSLEAPDGDREGTPVALCEACGVGLAVVATRHAGIPDVIEDGSSGLLVDEGDVAGTAQAMLRVARDPALASALGRSALERVRETFSLRAHIERLWEVIRASLGARGLL